MIVAFTSLYIFTKWNLIRLLVVGIPASCLVAINFACFMTFLPESVWAAWYLMPRSILPVHRSQRSIESYRLTTGQVLWNGPTGLSRYIERRGSYRHHDIEESSYRHHNFEEPLELTELSRQTSSAGYESPVDPFVSRSRSRQQSSDRSSNWRVDLNKGGGSGSLPRRKSWTT